jgi:hypothetical protein
MTVLLDRCFLGIVVEDFGEGDGRRRDSALLERSTVAVAVLELTTREA